MEIFCFSTDFQPFGYTGQAVQKVYTYLSRPTKTQKWRINDGKTNDTGAAPQSKRPDTKNLL